MGDEFYIEKLKQMLKTKFGRDMKTPADFSDLSDDIRDKLKCNTMSATTLKRLFGYIKYDKDISLSSLSLLARYLGYSGWNAFCMNDKSESGFISEEIIYSKNLIKGDSVLFEWNPNRSCVAEFLGNDRFLVKDAQYCKLEIGDTFTTTQFILNNPLIITDLIQVRMPGEHPKKYVAGNKSGLTKLRKAKKNSKIILPKGKIYISDGILFFKKSKITIEGNNTKIINTLFHLIALHIISKISAAERRRSIMDFCSIILAV